MNGGANELRDETLHGATHGGVLAGQGRQRASLTADDIATVLLNASHSPELFVEQIAGGLDTDPRVPEGRPEDS